MEDKLKIYFDFLRNENPVVISSDIQKILVSGKRKSKFKYKRIILNSSAVIILCIGTYYLFQMNTQSKTTSNVELTKDVVLSDNHTKKLEQNTNTITRNNSTKQSTTISHFDITSSIEGLQQNKTVYDESPLNNVYDQSAFPFSPTTQHSNNNIELTHSELAQFGIHTDGKSLQIICYSKVNNDTLLFKLNVEPSGSFQLNNGTNLKNLGIDKVEAITPVAIEVINPENGGFHLVTEPIDYILRDQFMTAVKESLIGIKVELNKHKKKYRSYIFWYKPNKEVSDILPDEIKNSVNNVIRDFNEIQYLSEVRKYSKDAIALIKSSMITPELIRSINNKAYTLNNQGLKDLKIEATLSSFKFKNTFKLNRKSYTLEIYKDTLRETYTNINNSIIIDLTNKSHAIYPVAYSDSSLDFLETIEFESKPTDKSNRYELEKRKYESFKSSIPNLFAIKLVLISSQERTVRLLWFADTSFAKTILDKYVLNKTLNLNGIHLLALNETALSKLKIESGNGKINFPVLNEGFQLNLAFTENSGKSNFPMYFRRELKEEEIGDSLQVKFDTPTIPDTFMYFKKIAKSFPSPIIATDENGQKFYFNNLILDSSIRDSDGQKIANLLDPHPREINSMNQEWEIINKQTSNLIPILVPSKGAKKSFKMILWYQPTPAFLALLPTEIGNEIESEFDAIRNNKPAPSCYYFEACKNNKGKISESILYPNPFKDELHIDITLEEDRNLTFYISDISGKIIQELERNKHAYKGNYSTSFQLNNLSDGIYLLTIETDKGETITQRIIKNH